MFSTSCTVLIQLAMYGLARSKNEFQTSKRKQHTFGTFGQIKTLNLADVSSFFILRDQYVVANCRERVYFE